MKKTLHLFIALLALYCLPINAQKTWNISVAPNGTKGGYIETIHGSTPNVPYSVNFPSSGYFPVYYVHFPVGTYEVTSENNCSVDVSRVDPKQELIKGGSARNFTFEANRKGWYRIALKNGTTGQRIQDFTVTQKKGETGEVYLAGWRSIPSLHLNGFQSTDPNLPIGDRYDWIYNEVQIPTDADFLGTYVEAFGFNGGYIGIQNNGPHRHDIIFSAWDNGDTDADPNLAGYKKSGTITWAKDPHVVVERFGGEGTGGHVIIQGDQWKPGQWVKFLINARPEEIHIHAKSSKGEDSVFTYTNTLLTAWYKAEGVDTDWHFVACHRMAGKLQYFGSGFNSFLEEFTRSNTSQGNAPHKGYYRRIFTRDMGTGVWFNRNQFWFGHTDGGTQVGARNDRYQTALEDFEGEPAMYMQAGGYIEPFQGQTNIPLVSPLGIVPKDIVLDSLYRAEIVPAIQKQDEQRIETYINESMDKANMKDWRVRQVSSEETNKDNAPASNILDGNPNTFWHSAWSTQSPNYPHFIILEHKDRQPISISRIRIQQSRADRGYCAGDISVFISDRGFRWTPIVEHHILKKEEFQTIVLPQEVNTAFIKIVFNAPAPECNKFLFINELNFYTPDVKHLKEVAKSYLDNADQFDSYPAEDMTELQNVYNQPNVTFNELSEALIALSKKSHIIKYTPIRNFADISSDRAYHIFNANGYGHLVTDAQTPTLSLREATIDNASESVKEKIKVQVPRNNWMIIPVKDKANMYYVYNLGYNRFLNTQSNELSEAPVLVKITHSNQGFRIFKGGSWSPLTAHPESPADKALNYVNKGIPAIATYWTIYDNYNVRPDFNTLEEVRESTKTQTPTNIVVPTERQPKVMGIYDLQGRRVKSVTKGIYIINGKKVLFP